MKEASIRSATIDDVEAIYTMLCSMAATLRPDQPIAATRESLTADGYGDQPKFEVLIAEHRGVPCGFLLFTSNYSTWEGRQGFFIEDIYVSEAVRRLGVGRLLMRELARLAVSRNCGRIDLNVLHWNPARAFYASLGIEQASDWLPYRVAGAALRQLAE